MSTKFVNFLAMSWFLSILICLAIEGSQLGASTGSGAERTVINDFISFFGSLKLGGLLDIPISGYYLGRGLVRILLWDYSFYSGGYVYLRYFWLITLDSGVAWAILATIVPIAANFVRIR